MMNIQAHELDPYDRPEEGSELHQAVATEAEVRSQRMAAQQVLQARTQELRILMSRFKQFNSHTSVEEVVQAQQRAEALRWLITCIEREVREWDEVCCQKAAEVRRLNQRPNVVRPRVVDLEHGRQPITAVLLPA